MSSMECVPSFMRKIRTRTSVRPAVSGAVLDLRASW
jgi:hypothetical protein